MPAIEINKANGERRILEDINTPLELAIYVAHKYRNEYPDQYSILFNWLLSRNWHNRDNDGKPDCIDQPDALVDTLNPQPIYHMKYHDYCLEDKCDNAEPIPN